MTVNPADDPPVLRNLTLEASANAGAAEARVSIPRQASAQASISLYVGIEFVPDGYQRLISGAYTNGDLPYGPENKTPTATVELKVSDPRMGNRIEVRAFVSAETYAKVEAVDEVEEIQTDAQAKSSNVVMKSFDLLTMP